MFGRTAAAACLFALGLAAPARAGDVAAAGALFDRGLADMEAGKLDTGCPAIEESYRLDPRPGTLFTLAECEAKRGRVATASSRYEDYLALYQRLPADQQAKQRGREKVAAEKMAELAPQIPQLTLVLPPAAPKGTVVARDDVELEGPALGVALPVDPGLHVITVKVPGRSPGESRVTLAAGDKKTVKLDLPPERPAGKPAATVPAPTEAPRGTSAQRIAGFAVGGLGVAGVVLGAVTGGLALGAKSVVNDNCIDLDCNHDGKVAADRGKTMALVSTVGFGVGLAALVTGTVLVVTAPKPGPRVGLLAAGQDGAIFGVRGAW